MIRHHPNSPLPAILSAVPVRRGHGDVAAPAAERTAAEHRQQLLRESQSPVYQEAETERPVGRAEMTGGDSWRRLGSGRRLLKRGEQVRRLLCSHVNVGTRSHSPQRKMH